MSDVVVGRVPALDVGQHLLLVHVDEHAAVEGLPEARPVDLAGLEDGVAVGQDDGRAERGRVLRRPRAHRGRGGRRTGSRAGTPTAGAAWVVTVLEPVALEGAEVVGVAQLLAELLEDPSSAAPPPAPNSRSRWSWSCSSTVSLSTSVLSTSNSRTSHGPRRVGVAGGRTAVDGLVTSPGFPGWRNWQRGGLLIRRLRVRAPPPELGASRAPRSPGGPLGGLPAAATEQQEAERRAPAACRRPARSCPCWRRCRAARRWCSGPCRCR